MNTTELELYCAVCSCIDAAWQGEHIPPETPYVCIPEALYDRMCDAYDAYAATMQGEETP